MKRIYKYLIQNKMVAFIAIIFAIVGIIGIIKTLTNKEFNIDIYYLIGILMIFLILFRTIISALHIIFIKQNNVYCDTGQYGSKYDLEKFITKNTNDLYIIGQNLRTVLSQNNIQTLQKYLNSEKEKYLTLILTPYDVLKKVFPLSAKDLKISIKNDLRTLENSLSSNKKQRLKIGFHYGTVTLSAMIRNPKDRDAVLVLNPKWAFDRTPNNRLYCVIERNENQECFNTIWGGVTSMLQSECKSLEEMDRMIN